MKIFVDLRPLASESFYDYESELKIALRVEEELTQRRNPFHVLGGTILEYVATDYAQLEMRMIANMGIKGSVHFEHYTSKPTRLEWWKPIPKKETAHDRLGLVGRHCEGFDGVQRDSLPPRVTKDRRMPYWRPGRPRTKRRGAPNCPFDLAWVRGLPGALPSTGKTS